MPTQPRAASLFESVERLTKKAVQPVGEVVKDVAGDVKESLGLTAKQRQQIKQGDTAKISQIQQSIAIINQQMAEARQKREQKWQEQNKRRPSVPQQRDFGRARKDSVLEKLLKSRAGTKEAMPRASG